MKPERVRNSFGKCIHNKGTKLEISREPYRMDNTREYYLFDIIPMGAVRMTKSDTWKIDPNHIDEAKRQRKVVTRYFAFKTELFLQAKQMNFTLGKNLDVLFLIPMPDSWSAKKKEEMNRLPCEVKPDTDNLTKAVKDTLRKQDSDIWWEKAEKRWAHKGSIIIFA
jgi:Holliday junction resolvase RusA-like endonuclease